MTKASRTNHAAAWARLASLKELEAQGRLVVRAGRKQIALFASDGRVLACNNRCPHEGYPLTEGHLAQGCVLTCNWHNWKFDLRTGETLVGSDTLRVFPVRVDGDDVLVDVADPPPGQAAEKALADLEASFDGHEYGRIAREVARLIKAGGDPLEAVRRTILRTFQLFEFGTTHAVAGAADWLALRERVAGDPAAALAAVVETIGHFVWDSYRRPAFPYAEGNRAYAAPALVDAIEAEDEARALRLARGALAEGGGYGAVEPALLRAALAHYQDFGHSLIYVLKTGQLADRLGGEVVEPLTLMMVRSLVYASREDLIPEFKAYGPALGAWDGEGRRRPAPEELRAGGLESILERLAAGSAAPRAVFDAALDAAAWQMLHYDTRYQDHTDKPVSRNVGWLSFTHALTFANAVRVAADKDPALWAPGLLQMGCFLARNAPFVDPKLAEEPWRVDDPVQFLADRKAALVDHGQSEYIVSCHLLKTITAVEAEVAARPDAPWAGRAAAAVNRFLNAPLKRKHALRTAKQALAFVEAEG